MRGKVDSEYVFNADAQCSRCGAIGAYIFGNKFRCPNCMTAILTFGGDEATAKDAINLACVLQFRLSRLENELVLLLKLANKLCAALSENPAGVITADDPAFVNLRAAVQDLKSHVPF
jgi:hypothetical protein